jgi:hypothetical protein
VTAAGKAGLADTFGVDLAHELPRSHQIGAADGKIPLPV